MNDSGDAYKVYKLISPSGGIYIGITMQPLKKRFMNGYGYRHCPAIHNAIEKYGWDSFRHEILFENLTKKEAEQKEIELIAFYKSNQKEFGYNIENGGNTAGTHSEETKKKISEGNKGKRVSEETRQKLSYINKGKKVGKENPFYGKHHSEKCRKKHSEFMKGNKFNLGKHHSEEFKQWKSKQMHEKYKDGNNPRCKRIIHYDDSGNIIKIYMSLREVARELNHSTSTIYKWVHNIECKEWVYEERT